MVTQTASKGILLDVLDAPVIHGGFHAFAIDLPSTVNELGTMSSINGFSFVCSCCLCRQPAILCVTVSAACYFLVVFAPCLCLPSLAVTQNFDKGVFWFIGSPPSLEVPQIWVFCIGDSQIPSTAWSSQGCAYFFKTARTLAFKA
ncbi:hypothetical protein FISHEDRAFT_59220 [Fistulina hepatica ATCC 64428]|uniref:Uncharacterized protein n=1 Tax=Fistulina hepatica ATCC 64428 TaxID=1128425 RepID=A0A0D7ACF5_9AGAR|nr:hypothetical protein FISHEDRAFT_59220 [Fistulina hepatica ATCC 64428]